MRYQIWAEGFVATGQSGTAHCLGAAEGETLAEAVKAWAAAHPSDARYVNGDGTSYWGCRLFDNESAARRVFG